MEGIMLPQARLEENGRLSDNCRCRANDIQTSALQTWAKPRTYIRRLLVVPPRYSFANFMNGPTIQGTRMFELA